MSSNWPKVLVIWLAAASQISVTPANFVAMSVTKGVTNRLSPICVTKCFKMSFRRRFYLTPIFWFRSQFFRIFRSIPNFPFTFYNLKRKFLLIFFCLRSIKVKWGHQHQISFLSLWFSRQPVGDKNDQSRHQHISPPKSVTNIDVSNHFISYLKIKSVKHEKDFLKFFRIRRSIQILVALCNRLKIRWFCLSRGKHHYRDACHNVTHGPHDMVSCYTMYNNSVVCWIHRKCLLERLVINILIDYYKQIPFDFIFLGIVS